MTDTGGMSDAERMRPSSEDHDDHASGHDRTSAGEPLGPVDVTTWAYAISGALSGLVLLLALLAAGTR